MQLITTLDVLMGREELIDDSSSISVICPKDTKLSVQELVSLQTHIGKSFERLNFIEIADKTEIPVIVGYIAGSTQDECTVEIAGIKIPDYITEQHPITVIKPTKKAKKKKTSTPVKPKKPLLSDTKEEQQKADIETETDNIQDTTITDKQLSEAEDSESDMASNNISPDDEEEPEINLPEDEYPENDTGTIEDDHIQDQIQYNEIHEEAHSEGNSKNSHPIVHKPKRKSVKKIDFIVAMQEFTDLIDFDPKSMQIYSSKDKVALKIAAALNASEVDSDIPMRLGEEFLGGNKGSQIYDAIRTNLEKMKELAPSLEQNFGGVL